MKKLLFTLLVAMTMSVAFTSCKLSGKLTQHPKFVSVENLITLKLGSSFEQTVVALGSQPYDLLSKQIDGYDIYLYKYKKVERCIEAKTIDNRGSELNGNEKYYEEICNAYLMFKDDKLQMVITDKGKDKSGYLIVLNNKMYKVSTDLNSEIVIEEVKHEQKDELLSIEKPELIKKLLNKINN